MPGPQWEPSPSAAGRARAGPHTSSCPPAAGSEADTVGDLAAGAERHYWVDGLDTAPVASWACPRWCGRRPTRRVYVTAWSRHGRGPRRRRAGGLSLGAAARRVRLQLAGLDLVDYSPCGNGRPAADVEVPWTLPELRREWNRAKHQVAPWWAENSKEAYNSGLDGLARALRNFSDSKKGRRKGRPMGFPRRKKSDMPGSPAGSPPVRSRCCPTASMSSSQGSASSRPTNPQGSWPAAWNRAPPASWPPPSLEQPTAGRLLHVRGAADDPGQQWQARCGRRGCGRSPLGRAVHRNCGSQPQGLGTLAAQAPTAEPRTGSPQAELPASQVNRAEAGPGACPGSQPAPRCPPQAHHLPRHRARHHAAARPPQSAPGSCPRRSVVDVLATVCASYGSWPVADPFYPSSKACSACGWVKAKLTLAERTFHCEVCGLVVRPAT